ncbi:hypothetical protein B0H14DRAFT_2579785 [Mycena olivaceomarginata]|nr:hypothetical protein B0H14DRAFT_2579785 [Mycena olivaceomarginata]
MSKQAMHCNATRSHAKIGLQPHLDGHVAFHLSACHQLAFRLGSSMTANDPRSAPELEQIILELCAADRPAGIPGLMLVVQGVKECTHHFWLYKIWRLPMSETQLRMRDRRKARGRLGVICGRKINFAIPSGPAGSIIHRVKRGFSAVRPTTTRCAHGLDVSWHRGRAPSPAPSAPPTIAHGDTGARFRMWGSEMASRERVITHLLQRRGSASRQRCSGFGARAAA